MANLWSLVAGALPPGLSLGSDGTISGTPVRSGTFLFTVEVSDDAGDIDTQALSITVYAPIVLAGPAPGRPWKFLYGPAQPRGGITGNIGQATSRTLTLRCEPDQASECSVVLDARGSPAAKAITELTTDLQVMYGSSIVFCGRVVPTQDTIDSSGYAEQITAYDYREVLKRRALMSGGAAWPHRTGAAWTYTNIDQQAIALDMIKFTQSLPGGDLGIVAGAGSGGTGIARTMSYSDGDYIGDKIAELAALDSGFEWQVTPYGPADLRFDCFYPQQGRDKGLVLAYGMNRIQSVTRSTDPSAFGNSVMMTGDTSVAGLVPVRLDADGLATDPAGRWDMAVGNDLQTQSALTAAAQAALAQNQVLIPSYTVVLQPGSWGGPGDIWMGDTVNLQIKTGRLAVNDKLRVVEMAFAVDESGLETLTLTIGRLPLRVWKLIPAILKNLRYLNTR